MDTTFGVMHHPDPQLFSATALVVAILLNLYALYKHPYVCMHVCNVHGSSTARWKARGDYQTTQRHFP